MEPDVVSVRTPAAPHTGPGHAAQRPLVKMERMHVDTFCARTSTVLYSNTIVDNSHDNNAVIVCRGERRFSGTNLGERKAKKQRKKKKKTQIKNR
jgi:hypothetical protein